MLLWPDAAGAAEGESWDLWRCRAGGQGAICTAPGGKGQPQGHVWVSVGSDAPELGLGLVL